MKNTALASTLALFVVSFEKLELCLKLAALLMPIVVGLVQLARGSSRRRRRCPKRFTSSLPVVLAGVFLVVCCSGCVNTAAIVKELGRDTNSVSVSVRSPWGTVDVKRN